MTDKRKKLGQVKILPMEPGDIGAVLEFDKRIPDVQRAVTYGEHYSPEMGGSLETSFVAEAEGEMIGFVLARIARPGEPIAGEGLIQTIGIDPRYHRRGIATRLVNAFLDQCRARGIGSVHVIINEKDNQLQPLFVSMGFGSGQLVDYALKL